MSVVDVVHKLGLYVPGMSFPQMTSIALSSMLESFRQSGVIPTRDGFEYNEIMAPYANKGRNKRALSITNGLQQVSSDIQLKALVPEQAEPTAAPEVERPISTEEMLLRRRLAELCSKKEMAEDGAPGVVWGAADEAEYQQVYLQVYPHG